MSRYSSTGFSLVELILVLAIILFLATLSVPRLSFIQRHLAKADANQLLITLLYLQREAMVANTKKKLKFLVNTNSYSYNGSVVPLSQGVCFGVAAGVYGPPSGGLKTPKSAVTYNKQTVEFLPDGKMNAGSVYLTDRNRSCMYALTTPISQVSYIRMYTYYKGTWERIR